MANRLSAGIIFVLLALGLSGCAMNWTPHWQDAGPDRPSTVSRELFEQARQIFEQARDRESLLVSIDAHRKVLAANPGDFDTLTSLSNQSILLGTAYAVEMNEKSQHFRQAMQYAELAMYTNEGFRKRVAAGAPPWEAAGSLGKKEAAAMFFWVTALQYEFKEGMTLAGKIANVSWMQHALTFLDHIEQVDPDFGGGGVEFAKVICYYVLPAHLGGSETKGDEYMARAVTKGEQWLLPRWARGKYYYAVKGDKEKSRQDLEWVLSRDLSAFKDPTPWKIHFQEDARTLLN